MDRIRSKGIVLTAVAVALASVSFAQAATESFSSNFAFALSPGSQKLLLPQFDTLGGTRTLTQVDLYCEANAGAAVDAENDSPIAGTMGVDLTGLVNCSGPSSLSALAGIVISVPGVSVAATDGVPGSGPDYHNFGAISGSGNGSNSLFASLAPYIGVGNVSVNVNGNGGFAVSGVTSSTIHVANFGADGLARVTYHYIPEPASLAMLLLGGLVAFRRRR